MVSGRVIYQIRNTVNNKIYIGSTIDYVRRKKRHLCRLDKGNHHSIILQRSWNKHGSSKFIFEVIEIVSNKEIILEREQHYLDLYKSYNPNNGYNICKVAGSSIGFRDSEETKNKMSKSHSGVKKVGCSDVTKKKIRDSKLELDLCEVSKKRKVTLLDKDKNIFKKIGEKSSKTQKNNGLNKGVNNPNYDNRKVLIYNRFGDVVYNTNNNNFKKICKDNDLPIRVLIKSKNSDGEYKLYIKRLPRYKRYKKYIGWYCKYKN